MRDCRGASGFLLAAANSTALVKAGGAGSRRERPCQLRLSAPCPSRSLCRSRHRAGSLKGGPLAPRLHFGPFTTTVRAIPDRQTSCRPPGPRTAATDELIRQWPKPRATNSPISSFLAATSPSHALHWPAPLRICLAYLGTPANANMFATMSTGESSAHLQDHHGRRFIWSHAHKGGDDTTPRREWRYIMTDRGAGRRLPDDPFRPRIRATDEALRGDHA